MASFSLSHNVKRRAFHDANNTQHWTAPVTEAWSRFRQAFARPSQMSSSETPVDDLLLSSAPSSSTVDDDPNACSKNFAAEVNRPRRRLPLAPKQGALMSNGGNAGTNATPKTKRKKKNGAAKKKMKKKASAPPPLPATTRGKVPPRLPEVRRTKVPPPPIPSSRRKKKKKKENDMQ
jgi:hypothetical protein